MGKRRFIPETGDQMASYFRIFQGSATLVGLVAWPDKSLLEPPEIFYNPMNKFKWLDNVTGRPSTDNAHLAFFEDCATNNALLINGSCVKCSPGHFFDEYLKNCRACQPGFFQAEPGRSSCQLCEKGNASTELASAACSTCLPGRFAAERGASDCAPCSIGEYADGSGEVACIKCDIGFYEMREASIACVACPLKGQVTRFYGSEHKGECACPRGTFAARVSWHAVAECSLCADGLDCPGGNGAPLSARGFKAETPHGLICVSFLCGGFCENE